MKSKKIRFTTLFCFALLLFIGCNKQYNVETKSKENNLTLAESAKSWYQNYLVTLENEDNKSSKNEEVTKFIELKPLNRMGRLGKILEWEKAIQYEKEGIKYLIVPVNDSKQSLSNKKFKVARSFVFYTALNNEMQMEVIEVLSGEQNKIKEDLQNIASNAFINKMMGSNNNIENYNLSIAFYDKKYSPETSYQLSNGIWSEAGFRLEVKRSELVREAVPTLNSLLTEAGCQKYYLVGFWYDIVTGQMISSEILGSYDTCWNDNPPVGYGNNNGAPPTTPPVDCAAKSVETLRNMASSAVVSNETKSISTIFFGPQGTSRKKKYEWVILKSIGWYLFSFESGEHKNTGSLLKPVWQWKSLTHDGISLVGVVAGGSVDYSLISATPTLGLYNAIMALKFSVKYSLICRGSPFSSTLVYPSTKNFNVND